MRMFASIAETPLPDNALLQRYVRSGDYTDCFSTRVDTVVSLPQYINAFYTTGIFKTERVILKWLVSRPSTDEDVRQLADASCDTFAAWSVQDRTTEQILLIDMHGRTCSWLMVVPSDNNTRLYFGSAVIKTQQAPDGKRMSWMYGKLLGLHRLYSRILLSAARKRLMQFR